MRLLHIDVSARGTRSVSRALTAEFVALWSAAHPEVEVVYRDLGHYPVPFVDETWITAAYTDPGRHTPVLREALRCSDELVDEFLAAQVVVVGLPMYNFGLPAVFKAYIDQIVRLGRTFDGNFQGLVHGTKVYVLSVRGGGGYGPGQSREALDFENPYLRAIFGFIGVTDLTFVDTENTIQGGETVRASLAAARERLAELVAAT